MSSDAAPRPGSALTALFDIVIAPQSAFAILRERPYVVAAFFITALLGVAGALLQAPAGEHMAAAMFGVNASHDPQIAAMTPEQQQGALKAAVAIQHWVWVFYPVIVAVGVLVAAIVLFIFKALGRGGGSFRQALSLATNVALINYGIAYLAIGIIAAARGADSFSTPQDIQTLIPSAAWLVPGGGAKAIAFLASINPFTIWSLILLAIGQRRMLDIATVPAWIGAVVLALGPGLFAVAVAR
jgi:hypothetical protein